MTSEIVSEVLTYTVPSTVTSLVTSPVTSFAIGLRSSRENRTSPFSVHMVVRKYELGFGNSSAVTLHMAYKYME